MERLGQMATTMDDTARQPSSRLDQFDQRSSRHTWTAPNTNLEHIWKPKQCHNKHGRTTLVGNTRDQTHPSYTLDNQQNCQGQGTTTKHRRFTLASSNTSKSHHQGIPLSNAQPHAQHSTISRLLEGAWFALPGRELGNLSTSPS